MDRYRFARFSKSSFARELARRCVYGFAAVAILACGNEVFTVAGQPGGQNPPGRPNRTATVEDGIELTRLADSAYFSGESSSGQVAQFSPDGKRFVIVLQKGNIRDNTNEYSLLLFKTAEAFKAPKPEVALRMSSSSNRGAIRSVRWLPDNRTLVFLGEHPGETPQVFAFDIERKHLWRRTHHPSEIYSYDTTEDGRELIFLADPVVNPSACRKAALSAGLVIDDQQLSDLVRDPCRVSHENQRHADLFLQSGSEAARHILGSDWIRNDGPLILSPDGRFALVGEDVTRCPSIWRGYQADYVQDCFALNIRRGGRTRFRLRRYLVVDFEKNESHPLLDVPSFLRLPNATWAADSRSVSLSRTYLPLDVADRNELSEREKHRYDATVQVVDGGYQKLVHYGADVGQRRVPLDVFLEENFDSPFKVYVSDPKTKQRALLLDLNPQLASIALGDVELVEWKDSTGHLWKGALYLPFGYATGKRYPFVIQTHGFTPLRFSMDGLNDWSSAFAARPLAAAGFVVLQAGDWSFNTIEEGPRLMAEYEAAIDFFDKRGLIDRDRVGITGFSRTVYDVGYTLTHSSFPFAAAVLADGIDACYFSYVATMDTSDVIALNGGKPFGTGLQSWLVHSPCFNLDRVRAPIRLMSFGDSGNVLLNWEWFSVLERLNKPIEFVLLPTASHQLVKPWERRTAQQGLVDWFRFWLKNEEDSSPEKTAQYMRWRELRRLKEMETAKTEHLPGNGED